MTDQLPAERLLNTLAEQHNPHLRSATSPAGLDSISATSTTAYAHHSCRCRYLLHYDPHHHAHPASSSPWRLCTPLLGCTPLPLPAQGSQVHVLTQPVWAHQTHILDGIEQPIAGYDVTS